MKNVLTASRIKPAINGVPVIITELLIFLIENHDDTAKNGREMFFLPDYHDQEGYKPAYFCCSRIISVQFMPTVCCSL